ncbi:hypothetical protein [Streptomyces sp. NPDC093225]|uniref:hypothetical protein n=1 Tax=Streptomyces sp. NPDC093225 TaxID=3366034 RepID=UPI0037F43F30
MSDRSTANEELAPVYAALGRMVHTATEVEFATEFTGLWLAPGKTEANKLKGKMINALCDLAVSYAKSASYLTPSMRAALDTITRDIRDGMEHRNAYVHGYWAEPDGVLTAMNSRAYEKEPTGFRVKPLSVERLRAVPQKLVGPSRPGPRACDSLPSCQPRCENMQGVTTPSSSTTPCPTMPGLWS